MFDTLLRGCFTCCARPVMSKVEALGRGFEVDNTGGRRHARWWRGEYTARAVRLTPLLRACVRCDCCLLSAARLFLVGRVASGDHTAKREAFEGGRTAVSHVDLLSLLLRRPRATTAASSSASSASSAAAAAATWTPLLPLPASRPLQYALLAVQTGQMKRGNLYLEEKGEMLESPRLCFAVSTLQSVCQSVLSFSVVVPISVLRSRIFTVSLSHLPSLPS